MYCISQGWEFTATYCSLGSTGICRSNWELLVAKAEDQGEAQANSPRPSGWGSSGCYFRHVLANSMRMMQGMDGDPGKTWSRDRTDS